MRVPPVYLIAGVAVGGALLWAYLQGAKATGEAIGGAVVDAVNGVIKGTVETIGEGVGIPRTDAQKCAAAKAAGDTWNASFYCPATDFFRYIWD